jgi:polyhydroxyalkanoate synthase
MSALHDPKEGSASLKNQLGSEISQLVQRGLKGLDYISSPPPSVGCSARTLLYRRGTLSLYHYQAKAEEIYRVPLLFVMPVTHGTDIFDLAHGQSLFEFLLARGYDVYATHWNAPTAEESGLKLEDYVLDFIPECIRRIQSDTGVEAVSLVGYCMGGVLASLYAALHPEGPLKNLVCLTTPVDFSKMFFGTLLENMRIDIDRVADDKGLLPGPTIVRAIDLHRPATRLAAKVRLWDNMWNDAYVKAHRRLERFDAETLPLPGAFCRQVLDELVEKNSLVNGGLSIGGKPVMLDNIRAPLLHVIARYDTLVPPECAAPLMHKCGSVDKEELVLHGGHVSLVAGPAAIKRMWPKLDEWLAPRSV